MWKDIIGFENRYQVNEIGDIRNVSSLSLLQPSIDKYGYKQIGIRKIRERKKYWFTIHKLVALGFLEQPANISGLQIDHIDRNKLNNHFTNLRWVTCQQNCDNRKETAWKTNTTTRELHITMYKNGYMLRINKHDIKHCSWHKTLESAIILRDSLK